LQSVERRVAGDGQRAEGETRSGSGDRRAVDLERAGALGDDVATDVRVQAAALKARIGPECRAEHRGKVWRDSTRLRDDADDAADDESEQRGGGDGADPELVACPEILHDDLPGVMMLAAIPPLG